MQRAHFLLREASARSRLGRLARSIAHLVGPPRERPGCACLPADRLHPPRVPALEQLLVRRTVRLRHVQRPLLPAGRGVRDQGARDHLDRNRRAGVRGRRLQAVGPACTLVEPDVRGRLGAASSSRPRSRSRSASRSACSRSGRSRPGSAGCSALLAVLTVAASPLAFLLLAIFLAGIGLGMLERGRRLIAPAAIILFVSAAASSCSCARSPTAATTRSRVFELALHPDLLRPRSAAHVARRGRAARIRWFFVAYGVVSLASVRLHDPARREHRPRPARRAPDRGARALAQTLAPRCRSRRSCSCSPRSWNLSPHAWALSRGDREHDGRKRRLLATRGDVPAQAPDALLPGRGGRHRGPLGGRLSPAGRDSAHPRLVPAGRLPAERGALRQPRPARPTARGSGASASATSCSPTRRRTTARSRRRCSSATAAPA